MAAAQRILNEANADQEQAVRDKSQLDRNWLQPKELNEANEARRQADTEIQQAEAAKRNALEEAQDPRKKLKEPNNGLEDKMQELEGCSVK